MDTTSAPHHGAVDDLVDRAYALPIALAVPRPIALAAQLPYDRTAAAVAVLEAHDPTDSESVLAEALHWVEGDAAERTIASTARDLGTIATIDRPRITQRWHDGYGDDPDFVQAQAEADAIAAVEALLSVTVSADIVEDLLAELRGEDAPQSLIDAVARIGVKS